MYLELHANGKLYDRVEIEYVGMRSAMEKQRHQEALAAELYQRHVRDIRRLGLRVEIFVQVASKMNEEEIDDRGY